ncbi:MAG TPA: KilA-N domain-containing protein [Telluria sp.]|jgi:hypothetical protein
MNEIVHHKHIDVAGVAIAQDQAGRYCLNDLHKAAMLAKKATESHRPGNFLKTADVVKFAQVLSDATNVAPVETIKGGTRQGSYGVELIVMRYAAWIDPAFEVQVYQTFQAAANGTLQKFMDDQIRAQSRQAARLEAPYLTDAIKHRRKVLGKPTAHYHFSNEFDLINRVALGKSAKAYREAHSMTSTEAIRDHLTPMEIRCIEHLQRANATMIDLGYDFEQRKTELHKLYVLRHSAGLMAEVERIES